MSLLFVRLIAFAMVSMVHPHYVSTTTLEYDSANKTLEISVSMFADDLEKSLRKISDGKVDVLNNDMQEKSDSLVARYLRKALQLRVDGKPVTLNYLGFETEKGSVLAYLQVPLMTDPGTVTVTNTILYDTQQQQVNLLRFKHGEKLSSASLRYPASKYEFRL